MCIFAESPKAAMIVLGCYHSDVSHTVTLRGKSVDTPVVILLCRGIYTFAPKCICHSFNFSILQHEMLAILSNEKIFNVTNDF